MLFRRRFCGAILAFSIVLTFATSGFLHEIIPHDHGSAVAEAEDHCHPGDTKTNAEWATIHATLLHDGKKTLLSGPCVTHLVGLDPAIARAEAFVVAPRATLTAYEEMLRRGVLDTRKFG